jgi:hypothetical protein
VCNFFMFSYLHQLTRHPFLLLCFLSASDYFSSAGFVRCSDMKRIEREMLKVGNLVELLCCGGIEPRNVAARAKLNN